MTIIAFSAKEIYTDRSATSGVISRTVDRKVMRLHDACLMACAGLALTEAEASVLHPLVPQILAVRTPNDTFDLMEAMEELFAKSNLATTILFVTPTHYVLIELGRMRDHYMFTREECEKMPMAIGSGALHFIHSYELCKNMEQAVKEATLADPNCGRDVYKIDISKLGEGVEIPHYTPKPKPKQPELAPAKRPPMLMQIPGMPTLPIM